MNIIGNNQSKNKINVFKRNSHPDISFFLKHISPFNCGFGKKLRCKTETVIARYNANGYPTTGLTKKNLVDHVNNENTCFFYASSQYKLEETPVILDVDAHEDWQTSEEALRFVSDLSKLPLFKGLHYELSTNGKGYHGVLWIKKKDCSSKAVKQGLRNLQTYLKKLASSYNIDVEVKGLPPVIKYDKGNIIDFKQGVLARVPRDISAANKSTRVHLNTLMGLDVAREETTPLQKKTSRSTSLIKPEYIERLPDLTRAITFALPQIQNDRHKLVAEDFAIFFMLSYAMEENKDKSLPVSRYRNLWNALYKDGIITRAFNSSRFAVIRNYLSENGHINWIDHTFFNSKNKEESKSCKWGISNELKQNIHSILHTHTTFVLTCFQQKGIHQHKLPVWQYQPPNNIIKLRFFEFEAEKFLFAA